MANAKKDIAADIEDRFDVHDSQNVLVEDLCRICSIKDGILLPIFEKEGLENNLAEKINSFLPITVSLNDKLTHSVCCQCASHIIAWSDLCKCAIRTDKFLRHMINLNQENINENKDIVLGTKISQLKGTLDKNHVSSEVRDISDLSHVLQHKKLMEIKNDIDPNISESLTKTLPVKAKNGFAVVKLEDFDFEEQEFSEGVQEEDCYMYENLLESEDKLSDENNIISDGDLLQNFCNEVDDKNLNVINSESKIKYKCEDCDRVFSTKRKLSIHNRTQHDDDSRRTFRNKADREILENAKMCVDGRIYYHCSICGKNLYSAYTFGWHVRIHTGEKPFVCDLCGKQFRVSQGLARHLKETHKRIKNFTCDICHRSFATSRTVIEHRRIHTGERPYVCDLCGKAFKQKASLFVHSRSHSDVFPFRCSFCDKGFRAKSSKIVHETKHTGARPHECPICGRCFRIKHELNRHTLIHSSEKPFKCDMCNASFRQKRYLKNHSRNIHNVKL